METKAEKTPICRGERTYSLEQSTYATTLFPTSLGYSGYSFLPVTPTASTQRSLPHLKLPDFDSNPLHWQERSRMSLATVDSSSFSKD